MNNMVDVLFVFPKIKKVSTSYRSYGSPPIGLAYLAAMCEKEGYEASFLDMNIDNTSTLDLSAFIEKTHPRVLGVSFVTEARFEAFKVYSLVKRVNPDILTIAGGPHASLCAQDTLENVMDLDVIVRGEGEETFSELMRSITNGSIGMSTIDGISYREDFRIRHNPDRLPIRNLDALPFPALHVLSFEDYNFQLSVPGHKSLRAAPVLSSRGCPFRCNFCATSKVWGSKWRFRSPENILTEIEQLKRTYDLEAIWFVDDNFNASSKRLLSICQKLVESKLDLKWVCNIRVDNVKREHLESMAEAGCVSVEFGAESGSQRILDKIVRKGITVQQVRDVDQWCDELGIVTDAQFIISHPTETLDEAKETVNLMKSLKGKPTLQVLKIYPGTEIERIAMQKGLLPKGHSWSTHGGGKNYVASILGDAPLFLDKLTMDEISELMTVAWTQIKEFSLLFLLKKILFKISSPAEFFTLARLGLPVIVRRLRESIFWYTK